MDRATRDKFASGTQADVTSGNACWETPPEVFEKLNKDFGPFDIDLTADPVRALVKRFYGPMSPWAEDALTAHWKTGDTSNGYSNPPYGPFVLRLLVKAKNEQRGGFTSTLLLPMRVTKAFKACILGGPTGVTAASDLLFCDKRIIFHENGQPRWNREILRKTGEHVGDPAMFDSIIVRFVAGYDGPLRVGIWQVPEHGKFKVEYILADGNQGAMEPAKATAASEAP